MVQAIVDITVNQGIDPRDAVLVGGGGAAGLNSVRIARRLGCRTLLIPEVGAALSAAGALMSDLKAEYHAACFASTGAVRLRGRRRACWPCSARALPRPSSRDRAPARSKPASRFKVEARYATQVWEIEVPLRGGGAGHAGGTRRLRRRLPPRPRGSVRASRDPASAIEIVGWTAQVSCRLSERGDSGLPAPLALAARPARRAYFAATGWTAMPVHRFEAMAAWRRRSPDRRSSRARSPPSSSIPARWRAGGLRAAFPSRSGDAMTGEHGRPAS